MRQYNCDIWLTSPAIGYLSSLRPVVRFRPQSTPLCRELTFTGTALTGPPLRIYARRSSPTKIWLQQLLHPSVHLYLRQNPWDRPRKWRIITYRYASYHSEKHSIFRIRSEANAHTDVQLARYEALRQRRSGVHHLCQRRLGE